MNNPSPSENESRSPPRTGGVTTNATTYPNNDTAQPSLTSGFGSVMEEEHQLRALTEKSRDSAQGTHAVEIEAILRDQSDRLGAHLALLEQRYQRLPSPARFAVLRDTPSLLTKLRRPVVVPASASLPELAERHRALHGHIGTLIAQRPDGQRGELILAEIARSHEAMAGVLTTVLKEAEIADDLERRPAASDADRTAPEKTWENEGGAAAASRAP